MRWTFIRKCYWDGVLRHVGDEAEASISNPPPHAVPSHQYAPYEDLVVPVPRNRGFIPSSEFAGRTWGLPRGLVAVDQRQAPGVAEATRLSGSNPNELKPFERL